ncbi:MAG: HD-GYP domain-containing protein [Myxococcota bacterium]
MSPPPSSSKLQNLARLLIMQLHMVLRTFRIHEPGNRALLIATENLRDTINTLWASLDGAVRLQMVEGVAYLNDVRVRLDPTLKTQVDYLQDQFAQRRMGGIGFSRPVDAEALRAFLVTLTRPVEGDEDVAQLKESLLRFRELALELLDPRTFVEEHQSSDDDLRVDRRTFALQAYAKGVVAFREAVEALRKKDGHPARLNATRIVQDLVDVGTERVNFLLRLGAIKRADQYAYNHAVNVCILSVVIGRALGVERVHLVDLGVSGLFSDIGFALMPPSLIEQSRDLSHEEKAAVLTDMLREVRATFAGHRVTDAMMMRVVVAYEHHLPYRDPLRTRPLHPYSRIVAVADAFDALTTSRPWRDAYAADEALRILSQESGDRFDPLVVRVLVNLMGVYPLGCPVQLESGEVAVVYHSSHEPQFFDRPWVKVVQTSHGDRVRRTLIRNLAATDGPAGRVKRILRPQEVEDFDPAMTIVF